MPVQGTGGKAATQFISTSISRSLCRRASRVTRRIRSASVSAASGSSESAILEGPSTKTRPLRAVIISGFHSTSRKRHLSVSGVIFAREIKSTGSVIFPP